MGVRFDAAARRSILAATVEAERQGRARPLPTDLLVGLLAATDGPATAAVTVLGADVRMILRAAATCGTTGSAAWVAQTPDDTEQILQHAATLAAARGEELVSALHILTAAADPSGKATSLVLGAAGITSGRLDPRDPNASSVADRPDVGRRASGVRVGIGYDSHRFGEHGPLVLGGISIAGSNRLAGHSDGDAIAHAVTDAVLGAAGAGDIGEMFSDTDPANRDRNSLEMLRSAVRRVSALGLTVFQVDATVVAERPKIAPHRDAMRVALAGALGIPIDRVSVKGKTNEGMGWIGRGEGIACVAVATLAESVVG